ncbi:MAG: hypothetical protein FWC22_03810 [Treponema sp.]|nr:hypothetical protein [Treponema sp.]
MKQLRITLLAGLILLFLSGSALIVFNLIERNENAAARQTDNFHRILRGFDEAFEELFFTEREFDFLNGELDRLEKTAITVESWLSILKRRRAVANIHPASIVNYIKSIENAVKAFPSSQPIIAVAASSLVRYSPINNEIEAQIRKWLPLLTEPNFNSLRLSLHVLLGDFKNPAAASPIPSDLHSDGTQSVSVNLALLKTIRGDYSGAASDIQSILNEYFYEDSAEISALIESGDQQIIAKPSDSVLYFAAEYYYDFGSILRSAEIFSLINDERALMRQADALYLSGYTDIASTIWNILAGTNVTSLYNLAVTTDDRGEAALYLEKLINTETSANQAQSAMEFGLIHYSRLFNYTAAVSILQNNINKFKLNSPYIDLEICKRHAQLQNPAQQIAQTWLLLDRHENNEEIYKWAFWNLFFLRNYEEAKILLDRMELFQYRWHWIDQYKALYLMNKGELDEAENILRGIMQEQPGWQQNANLGRIMAAIHSPSRALEQYELAFEKIDKVPKNYKTASIIQARIAGCFSVLNKPVDAINSFKYALDLDPANMSAQLELDRFLGVID